METNNTECEICLEESEVPFYLETCMHIFCYTCIVKHLRIKSFCPKCLIPANRFDLNTKLKKHRTMPDYTSSKNCENKIKVLKKYKIDYNCSKKEIDVRFQDLLDILYKEQYKEKILSNNEIAYKINLKTLNKNKKFKFDIKILKGLTDLKNRIKKFL